MNITKRLISTVVYLNKTYDSKPHIQSLITVKLTEECAKDGLDARGADNVVIKWLLNNYFLPGVGA